MSLTPFVFALTAAAVAVAVWQRLPASVIAAIGITLAAWAHVAPQLPRGETTLPPKAQAAQRRWRELRWRVLIPNADWLLRPTSELDDFRTRAGQLVKVPGLSDALGLLAWAVMPSRFVSVIALALAAAAGTLPSDGRLGSFILPPEFVWVNALAAYLCVTVVDNVTRRTITQYDPSPGVSIGVMLEGIRERDGGAWRALVGFVLLGIATAAAVMLVIVGLGVGWLIIPWPVFCLGLGAVVTAASLHGVFRERGLEPWRDTVATRAAWVTRWEGLKNPDVHMLTHEKVGAATVDTFDAPATLGSSGAINMYPKVLPFLGAGVQAAMLTVPDTDSQGQPIAGSAHPARFRVLTWPADAEVDVNAASTQLDVVKLRVETAVFLAATEGSYPVPSLLDAAPLHTSDEGAAVWATQWTSPVPMAGMVQNILQAEGFSEGAEFYFGAFDDADLKDKTLLGRREKVQTIARWNQRWADLLKQGDKPPHLQYEHHRTARFDQQTTIHFQPFLVLQGLNPTSYFQQYIAQGLSTTLAAARFVTVTGLTGQFVPGGLPGERHPQGFTVIWSEEAVPTSPAQVTPLATRDAQRWVLAGQVNAAFDAAKLARPEVVEAQALTTRQSAGHVWKISLRLFDGVTAADVKAKAEKLRQVMGGVPWMRVTEWEHGCLLYVGAPPRQDGVKFASPQGLATCNKLDWEQAFLESGLTSPMDGASPKMLNSEPNPTNEKITRFEFSMPRGLNIGKVRESVSKLRAATVNEYVDIRESTAPDKFTILAAEANPMPFPAFMEWDKTLDASTEVIPFASSIDGTTMGFEPRQVAHQLILGGSGSGKSATLQVFLSGALRRAEVIVIDTVKGGADFAFAKPWLKAFVGHNRLIAAGEVLMWCRAEMLRRAKLNATHGVGSYRDLPEDVRPSHMYVFIDEFNQMMEPVSVTREPASMDPSVVAEWENSLQEKAAQAKVAAGVKAITTGARSAGITLIIAGQSLKADLLKAHNLSGFKSSYARIALGKMSWGDLASAFKDSSTLPDLGASIPKGRGIWETDDDPASAFQAWFEPGGQDEMAAKLREVLPELPVDERLDLDELEKSVASSAPKSFGQVIDSDDENDEVVEVELGDLGLEGALSFDMGLTFGDSEPTDDEPDDPVTAPEPTGDELDDTVSEDAEEVSDAPEVHTNIIAEPVHEQQPDESGELFSDDFFDVQAEPVAEAVPEPFVPELAVIPAAPELIEPPIDAVLEAAVEPEEGPDVVSDALPEPLFEAEPVRHEGAVRVADVPDGDTLVFGIDLPLPASAPETGWDKSEAVLELLRRNPAVTSVTWATTDLMDEDDIGIPHIALVEEMFARAGVEFIPETVHTVAPTDTRPVPAPAPTVPKAPADDDDWFSAPKPKSPITTPDIDF